MSRRDRALVRDNWQANEVINKHYESKGQEVPTWVKKRLTQDRLYATPKMFYKAIGRLATEIEQLGFVPELCLKVQRDVSDLLDVFDVLTPANIRKYDPDGTLRKKIREKEDQLLSDATFLSQEACPGYLILLDQAPGGEFQYTVKKL